MAKDVIYGKVRKYRAGKDVLCDGRQESWSYIYSRREFVQSHGGIYSEEFQITWLLTK
jgi:hypothetical protein